MASITAPLSVSPRPARTPSQNDDRQHDDRMNKVMARIDTLDEDMLAWQRQAACRGLEADIFYPSPPEGAEDDEAATEAKEICAMCAVSGECLEYAITVREKDGIWGGQTAAERVRIIRRRRRAAARKRNAQAAAAAN